jgi:dTMP kinase
MAARAQLVAENIRPALQAGVTIVCDRFLLANVVYQGSAGGLDIEDLWRVGSVATAGCMPDVTIVLDIDPAVAAERIQRGHDRLEKRGVEYFRRVRNGFIEQLPRCGGTTAVIDSSADIASIHQQIVAVVDQAIREDR